MSKTAEEILKDHFIKSMAIDKPDWPEIERIESVNNTMTREPLFLSTLKSAMTEFASMESDRRLEEFKKKLNAGVGRLDMYGPDNFIKLSDLQKLINSIH